MNYFLQRGIRTQYTRIEITLAAARETKFNQKLPSDIGIIFGLNTLATGVNLSNAAIITVANLNDLYLTIKDSSRLYIDGLRLTELCFEDEASQGRNAMKYLRVHIPRISNLDQSYISDPTAAVSAVVVLGLFYVPVMDVEKMTLAV